MPKQYHTVRMSRAPQVGDTFHSLYLDPYPEPNKWWKVMFAPVQVVSGGYAVTLQECAPPVAKGPVGEMVHDLLRSKPPEPTLGMIYAKVDAVHAYVKHMERRVNEILANGDVMRVQADTSQSPCPLGMPAPPAHSLTVGELAIEEILQLGYTIKNEMLYPPSTGIPLQQSSLMARVESVLNDALYGRATSTQIESVLSAVRAVGTP